MYIVTISYYSQNTSGPGIRPADLRIPACGREARAAKARPPEQPWQDWLGNWARPPPVLPLPVKPQLHMLLHLACA